MIIYIPVSSVQVKVAFSGLNTEYVLKANSHRSLLFIKRKLAWHLPRNRHINACMRSPYITYAGAIPGGRPAMVAVSTQPLSINPMDHLSQTPHIIHTLAPKRIRASLLPGFKLTILHIDHFPYSLKVVMANQYQVLEELGSKSYLLYIFFCENKQLTLL